MINLKGRSDFTELQGDRYDFCHICGPQTYRVVVHFDSGSVAPTVGETVTGATSGHNGIIENVVLVSGEHVGLSYGEGYYGTFFHGPSAGVMILTSPTGYDSESSVMFQDGEALTGTTSGPSFSLVDGGCGVNKSGRMYPDSMLITYNGIKYCKEHFTFMFKAEWTDEQVVNVNENLRGA